ncbi:MAG: cell division protein FtsH, partial [Chloroflexota bacterium]
MKNGIVYLLIGLSILAIFYAFFGSWRDTPSMDIVTVLQKAKNGEISQIEIRGDNLTVTTRDGRRYASYKESSVSMLKLLEDAGVRPDSSQFPKIVVQEPSRFGELSGLLYGLLPVLLFGGLLFLMMRQAQGANNQAFNFGKSRA